MSVIAWDGNTLAADKRASSGTLICTTTKIFRLDDNTFCGYTGNQDFGEQMVAWYKAGAKAEDFPASQRDKDDWARLIVVRSCTHIVPEPELPHANPLDLESLSAFTVVRYKTRKVMQDRYEVLEYERTPHPIRIEDKLRAWGSGRDFALAAMHLGKTAAEAVTFACQFDSACGNGVDTLAFTESPQEKPLTRRPGARIGNCMPICGDSVGPGVVQRQGVAGVAVSLSRHVFKSARTLSE